MVVLDGEIGVAETDRQNAASGMDYATRLLLTFAERYIQQADQSLVVLPPELRLPTTQEAA